MIFSTTGGCVAVVIVGTADCCVVPVSALVEVTVVSADSSVGVDVDRGLELAGGDVPQMVKSLGSIITIDDAREEVVDAVLEGPCIEMAGSSFGWLSSVISVRRDIAWIRTMSGTALLHRQGRKRHD